MGSLECISTHQFGRRFLGKTPTLVSFDLDFLPPWFMFVLAAVEIKLPSPTSLAIFIFMGSALLQPPIQGFCFQLQVRAKCRAKTKNQN